MTPSARRRMPGAGLGVLLAICNVCVISLGLGVAEREATAQIATLVFMIAIIPAVVTGAILGALADAFATRSPPLRAGLLGTIAIGALAAIATPFQMWSYVPSTAIPTFLAVLVLEWATRRRPADPPIPIATVR